MSFKAIPWIRELDHCIQKLSWAHLEVAFLPSEVATGAIIELEPIYLLDTS